jgi:hypothetical protein
MTANDTFEDTLTSVMLGAYTGELLDPVFHGLDKALEILGAYQVCSPERVYLLQPHDFDNLESRGLHPAFLGNLRHWRGLMTDLPSPEVEMLKHHELYFPETLCLYKPDDFERLESNGMPRETLENLRRWQQHMIDNPAPLTAETCLEIQLESGTILPVTTSVYGIGRDMALKLSVCRRSVSRSHCWLGRTEIPVKAAVLTDTSTKGTFVNGKKIIKGTDHILEYGDKVGIGCKGTGLVTAVRKPGMC